MTTRRDADGAAVSVDAAAIVVEFFLRGKGRGRLRMGIAYCARRVGESLFAVFALAVLLVSAASAGGADQPPASPLALPAPPVSPLRPASGHHPAGRELYSAVVRAEATRAGLPPDIADAVTQVESGYDPDRIGADAEVGLMQVLPSTARMLGYAGTSAELADPETNVHYGVMYLAQAWQLAGGDICTATMKYRAGHGETRFSYRSVDYCEKVRARLFALGYPVVGTVPVPTFGEPTAPSKGRSRLVGGRRGPDLAALNDRLRAIATQANLHAVSLVMR